MIHFTPHPDKSRNYPVDTNPITIETAHKRPEVYIIILIDINCRGI